MSEADNNAVSLAAAPICCPHCGKEMVMNAVARLAPESRMVFALRPEPGERVSARNFGESLAQMEKLLIAIGKDMGVKTAVLLDSVETAVDGTINAHLLIARFDGLKKSQKAKP